MPWSEDTIVIWRCLKCDRKAVHEWPWDRKCHSHLKYVTPARQGKRLLDAGSSAKTETHPVEAVRIKITTHLIVGNVD